MPIDPTKLANLLTLSLTQRVAVAEYIKVTWSESPSLVKYYANSAYHEQHPFTAIGFAVEPRLMGEPFRVFEINPDLRTETIQLTFDDIDKDITAKFRTNGSGVTVEFFHYYPQVNLHVSLWAGQLQAPQIYGWKTLQTVATNGFRSREQFVPKRTKPRECTANFGGRLPDADAIRTNLCPYDRHKGGTTGVFKTGTTPYTDCPRDTVAACDARMGTTDGRYFGGFNTDASATISDQKSGYLAVSKGNASALKQSIRVIAGTKHVRGLPLLLWRRELNSNDPDKGWVATVWEVGEGSLRNIRNIKVNEKFIEQLHLSIRTGERGQPKVSNYNTGGSLSNFSSTAHFSARYGWVNPLNITPANLHAECDVDGYNEVAVYDTVSDTFTRQWTDDRVWWLMECYTNQKFGLAYPRSRFLDHIEEWATVATWGRQTVTFTQTFPDGDVRSHTGRRTRFDAILEGRPVAEQIEDICRSGAISVPFQHEGGFTVAAFRAATAAELTNARVFTDAGESRNIVWDAGQPSIQLRQTPNDKIVNEITLSFEEASNFDTERPITVDDPDQKLLAGRALGEDNLQSVPMRFSAFGIRHLQEAVRLGYRMLWFGAFDEGGTKNNLGLTILTPFEQALGVRRYDIIKVVSSLLDGFTLPGDGQVQYFRVLRMRKVAGGRCEIVAQAYNHTAYVGFEGTYTPPSPTPPGPTPDPDPVPEPNPCVLTLGTITYDSTAGLMDVPIDPC